MELAYPLYLILEEAVKTNKDDNNPSYYNYKLLECKIYDDNVDSKFYPVTYKCLNLVSRKYDLKPLHRKISTQYLIFSALDNIDEISRTYLFDIKNSKLTEMEELQPYDLYRETFVQCVFDINSMLYILYGNNNCITLNRLIETNNIYIQNNHLISNILINDVYYTFKLLSAYDTAYNGEIVYTSTNASGNLTTCSFTNPSGSASIIYHYAAKYNRCIELIGTFPTGIWRFSSNGERIYDYMDNKYTVDKLGKTIRVFKHTSAYAIEDNTKDYMPLYNQPECLAIIPISPLDKPTDMPKDYALTYPSDCFYVDINNKIIIASIKNNFFNGVVLNLVDNTYKYLYIPASNDIYSKFNLKYILPYNSMTDKYACQPRIVVTYQPNFYNIDDNMEIKCIVNANTSVVKMVELNIKIRDQSKLLVWDSNYLLTPDSLNKECTYELTIYNKKVGVYYLDLEAKIIDLESNSVD